MAAQVIIAGTGHRPDKIGGYTQVAEDRVYNLAYDTLKALQPDIVISGMAIGWDQALAQAALDLKIPLHAYVPFEGQESRWPMMVRENYWRIRHKATHVNIICEGDYASWKMQKRNEAMVRDCTAILALWNGSSGGTANCVFYAQRQRKKVQNLWPEFMKRCTPSSSLQISMNFSRSTPLA